MEVRSKEFVGIAERIKSREMSVKSLIENLKSTLSECESQKSMLERELSALYAELAAVQREVEYDLPDFGRIASIEMQIAQAQYELDMTKDKISKTSAELTEAERENDKVEEERQQTFFEIRQRARRTSKDISAVSGMYGSYASVGASLQQSFQESYDALAQAANILGGSVESSGGRANAASASAARHRGGSAGGIAGTVAAIAGANGRFSAKMSGGGLKSMQSSGAGTPHCSCRTMGRVLSARKGPSFRSAQSSGRRDAMAAALTVTGSTSKAVNFSSGQTGGSAEAISGQGIADSVRKTKEKALAAADRLTSGQTAHDSAISKAAGRKRFNRDGTASAQPSFKIKDRIHSFFGDIFSQGNISQEKESDVPQGAVNQILLGKYPEAVDAALSEKSEGLTPKQRFEAVRDLPVKKLTKEQLSEITSIAISNLQNIYGSGILSMRLEVIRESIHFVSKAQVCMEHGIKDSGGILGYYMPKGDKIKINMDSNLTVGELLATIDHECMHMLSATWHGTGGVKNYNIKHGNAGMNEGITEMLSIDNMQSVYAGYKSQSYKYEVEFMRRFRAICGDDKLRYAYLHNDLTELEADFNRCLGSRDRSAFKEFCEDVDIYYYYDCDSVASQASDALQQMVEARSRIEEKLDRYRKGKAKEQSPAEDGVDWNSDFTKRTKSPDKGFTENKVFEGELKRRERKSGPEPQKYPEQPTKSERNKIFAASLSSGRSLEQQAEDVAEILAKQKLSGNTDEDTDEEVRERERMEIERD